MSRAEDKSEVPESFEERVERLEEIVEQLEEGEAPLEQSLLLFEEGIQLAKMCQVQLEEARERVQVLLEAAEDGTLAAESYEGAAED
ncbi:MAG: exodeoxyribonuclease VII small subunit [Candidatus Latescibacteria bacterium]|nr:exodeoxyribonuclease VII small subunit [Candidatus Latescibacterota bacterium]